ncbi:slipin family protein [Candidatus Micrarchaeota archaeon]|nr:slipin family protein [Candidatus Micrarchaeota archaeon]
MVLDILAVAALAILVFSVRVVYEYEKHVVFRLGKYSRTLMPGLNFIIPLIEWSNKVDMRLRVFDVPSQEAITRDNISVKVDAVLYYKIVNAEESVIEVRDFAYATAQLAQTTMRNAVGEVTLDQVLSERDKISEKIRIIVDEATDPWGVKVEAVELKRVELPEDMKRVMAKAAEAERVKRATIIRSDGEAQASHVLSQAATLLNKQEGALNLRTLQSLNDIASDPSNQVTFFVPLDIIKNYTGMKKK